MILPGHCLEGCQEGCADRVQMESVALNPEGCAVLIQKGYVALNRKGCGDQSLEECLDLVY